MKAEALGRFDVASQIYESILDTDETNAVSLNFKYFIRDREFMPDMSSRLLLMSGREERHCRTFCPAGHKMSDKENKNCYGYLPVSNWGKCLTGAQNVPLGAKGLLDILSGMPEIIFAITAVMFYLIFA